MIVEAEKIDPPAFAYNTTFGSLNQYCHMSRTSVGADAYLSSG